MLLVVPLSHDHPVLLELIQEAMNPPAFGTSTAALTLDSRQTEPESDQVHDCPDKKECSCSPWRTDLAIAHSHGWLGSGDVECPRHKQPGPSKARFSFLAPLKTAYFKKDTVLRPLHFEGNGIAGPNLASDNAGQGANSAASAPVRLT